ncbi:hydrogenase expression/formation protein HypE [Thermomicrobium sp. CFH 73360]|uniref:hydrogenase expression/formation protein HypE n=1 Tax=Thermomicrobium sp. CFH 73360 TaxID=2951987 RepID=UPI002076F495|nr:hydrogenase expression/formation protein HypE [Thermomicrobium sp. CFH 73360]MCM8746581.1 hydrogenase expression/formation protein HypE [Thermomicrobium sp. CFH 73360]
MRETSVQPTFHDAVIELVHGAGGKASRRLIEGLFLPLLANPALIPLEDSAIMSIEGLRLALTTDAFVVKPLRFPGGSIGELAVHGTVNDLAVSGARPLGLLAAFIVEAGLPSEVLRAEVEALAQAARRAGVSIVGGDTKVVEHGKADGLYIVTAGVGLVDPRAELGVHRVRPGDQILISGPIGDHGITVLLARGELDLEADLVSDTRALTPFVEALLEAASPGLHWMRDPTRGGVATALNELARDARVAITLAEEAIPVRDAVRGACELLGLDPLYIANEGQLLAVVDPAWVDAALAALQRVPGGEQAACIGEVQEQPAGVVIVSTPYGGQRVIDMLVGDPLPRIC